jgi:hypothetical protein
MEKETISTEWSDILKNELLPSTTRNSLTNLVESLAESQVSDTVFNRITTRSFVEKKFELKVFTPDKLEEVAQGMDEINRASNIFGRRDSQFTRLLLTIHHSTPERNLMQIIAEVENRRMALREANFKLKRQVLDLLEKLHEYEVLSKQELSDPDEIVRRQIQLAKLKVSIEESESGITDSRIYIEGALKEVYIFQKAYNEICETYGLENWDESRFEEKEDEYHIKRAIAQSIRDVRQFNAISCGNQDFLQMLGIDPLCVLFDIRSYLNERTRTIQSNPADITTSSELRFIEFMFRKYSKCVSYALETKGLKSRQYKEAMFLENNKN